MKSPNIPTNNGAVSGHLESIQALRGRIRALDQIMADEMRRSVTAQDALEECTAALEVASAEKITGGEAIPSHIIKAEVKARSERDAIGVTINGLHRKRADLVSELEVAASELRKAWDYHLSAHRNAAEMKVYDAVERFIEEIAEPLAVGRITNSPLLRHFGRTAQLFERNSTHNAITRTRLQDAQQNAGEQGRLAELSRLDREVRAALNGTA